MNKAHQLARAQLAAGKSKAQIAQEIGKSRTAVSLWLAGRYGASGARIEAALLKTYERRTCPADGAEKPPALCRHIALRPCPSGFPDAEALWRTCQTCPHQPLPEGKA